MLLRLRYPGGVSLSGLAAGCSPEVFSVGGRLEVLPPGASLALGGLLPGPATGQRLVRVPDYVGRHLGQAKPAAVSLYELRDPSVPFGEIVWQTPLPGTREYAGAGLELVVAVRAAPPCRAGQLVGRYMGTGAGAGIYIGAIALADVSRRPCTLTDRLTLKGVGTDGRADTDSASEPLAPTLVLGPGETLVAVFGFAAPNDDASQRCFHHETIPAAFALALGAGGRVQVANPAAAPAGHSRAVTAGSASPRAPVCSC